MATLSVNVKRATRSPNFDDARRPRPPHASQQVHHVAPDLEADLAKARWLAHLFDSRFEVAGVKFGLDSIIGLVPGVGDAVSLVAGLYPLYLARRHNLGKTVVARMAANLAADFAVGSVPILGDLVDIAYKAHLKNLKLLERAVEKHRAGK